MPLLRVNCRTQSNWLALTVDAVRRDGCMVVEGALSAALGDDVILRQPERTQQLLGWYTRVVTSLDEFYQPEEKRLYRRGQG